MLAYMATTQGRAAERALGKVHSPGWQVSSA